jgi:hypothetical protein
MVHPLVHQKNLLKMSPKLITFLTTIVLFIFVGSTYGQVNNTNKGAAVIYTTGLPTGAVRLKYDSEVAINTTNGKFYRYDRNNSAWIEAGSSIGYLNSGAAPSGDPKYGGPELIINNDKELYWYYGGVWNCVNCAALGYTAGTGINITGTTITNTLPDQTVTLGSGVGILVSGSYPNFTITNDDPDQTVTITGAGISNITGTYPNFTITSTEVDGSITNEIQRIDSLYLSNDTLFISLLNDALPASAIKLTGIGSGSVTGGGIYGQSDTVSYQHLAVIDSGLTFSSTEDTAYFNIVTAPGAFGSAGYFNTDSIRLRHYDIGGSNELILNDDGVLLKTTAPDRVTIEGNDARYAADYRATYSDRSLVDKEYGDDFYLQEIDTFRVSNDTLYISLIRDSVPESFVVLPAGSGSAINLYELDIITPLPAVDVEGSMVLKTVDVNGSKILYVSNGTDWVEGGLFLDTLNVATINIGNDQITYAKIQEVTAERLLGNPTGSTANPSEISLGSGLGFSGTTILNTGDLSTTNEIQQIDTFEIVSNILRASLGLDGVPFKSVDLSPYLDNTDSSGYNSAFTRSGDTLFITDGLSTKFVVLPSGIVDTDDQTLSLSNDTLYISQGNSVFLGQYLDNTDSQQLSIDSSIVEGVERFEISLDSSTSIYFDVPQVTDTDNQTIDTFSITNAIISLSLQDDALPASTIDITESVQDITGTMVESNTETGIAVTYDDGTGKLNFVAVDQSITNEIQTLDTFEIVSDALIASMLNDGVPFKSVDLSPYLDNTDTSGYNISFTRSNDTLYLNDGDGQLFVKLPADQIGVDTSGSNYTFTRSNDTLFIADQNGILSVKLPTDNIGLDTSGYNLDFSRSNDTLFIRDGNGILSVKLPASVSTDTSGYNLDFRISDDSLYIRDGQDELFVNLDPYLDNTDTSGSNYTFTRSNDTLFIADQDGILSVKLPADNIGLDTSGYNLEFIRSNDTLYLRDGDGILSVKLPESVSTDTSGYNLQVRISGDTLYIRDGDGELFVDLADYLDNTDAQTLLIDSTDIGGTIERFGITISNGNKVYIDVPQVSGSGAGQNNVGVNIGSGIGIYAGKTDTILQFKSLVEGYGIDLSNTSTEITIRADTAQLATSHDVAVVQGDIDAHELADGDLDDTNELQSLTIDSVAITGKERFLLEISDGNTVAFDVDLNTDTQDISIDSAATTGGQNFTVTLQDGGDVDFFIPTNTDNQTLILDSAIVGSVERFELEVSNGNSVFFDIPQITDTDNQTLDTFEIVSNILRASLTDDGVPFKSVDLSPYLDNIEYYAGYGIRLSGDSIHVSDTVRNFTNSDFETFALLDERLQLAVSWHNTTIHPTVTSDMLNVFSIGLPDMDSSSTDLEYLVYWDATSDNFRVFAQNGESVELFGITSTGAIKGTYHIYGDKSTDTWYITEVSRYYATGFQAGVSGGLVARTITGSTTIDVTNGNGSAGNPAISLAQQSATSGQVLKWNGSSWVPDSDTDAQNLTIEGSGPTYDIAISGGTDITVQGAGIITLSETPANTLVITGTEVDGSVTNEIQDITVTGASQPFTLDLGSDATDATFTGAGITTVTRSGNDLTFTSTEVDGSITNELQTISVTGTTTATLDLSSDASDASITGAGINVVSVVGDAITITGTEIDGSISNEGSLTVAAGTGTTSIINSNTSGQTGVTITAAGINTISEVGNVITLTATEVDGSVSNEGVLGVGAGSGTSSTLLSTTSGANAVTINAAGILAITESTSANGGSITLTATEVDGSITNEIQNLTYTAATGVVAIDGTGSTDATISVMTASTRGLVPDGDGSGTDEFLREDGTWAVPPSASTDLTIGGSGPTYTIESSTGTDVTIQASGITLSESPANTLIFTAVDGSITNEIQRLDTFEIVSNVLRASLLNDGLPFSSVSLSAYLDNTDNQTLDTFEIVSNILRASNFGDGVPFKSVDLSPYLDNTDTQDLSIDSTTIGSIERFTINLVGSPSISFDVSNTTGTVTSVAATQPAAGITISGSPITGSGTLTFALANDLAGLEGQSGTGIVVRTGDGTYAQRTATVFSSVASTANLAIGNANGVSGNPLISIETDRATNKLFVQAVSTTNLDLNGTETIDGVSVTNGQRVLVAGQTAQEDNGIWDVVSAGAWTRSTDANASAKIDPGVLVNVKLGSTYGGTMWRLTTVGPYTLGSTDLVFEEVFKDEDPTNELQTIDTLSLSGTVMSLSLEGDGLPASTLDFASIIGSAADVITLADSAALKAYTGAATGVLLKQAGRQGTFVRVPTTRAHDGFIVFTDGNGNKWQRIMDNVINVKWFGAKGDGVTDDTWAIQRAIDYSIYEDTLIKQVFIPSGNYVITKTIHLGYGNAYHSVSLIGDGAPTFRGEIASFNGTMLSPTFSNSPAINIQGARYTTVENITLVGLNDIDGFLSDTSASNINNWLDSGLDAIADNQRTPYAGITIDGFSGTAPSPAYAHYAYPSYAGDTTQYNKDFSSQVKISNCGIHGFVAGIVLQPNSDGNGDFTQVEKCIIDRVAYGISVGNANSRNFKILDCYIDAHTGITNSTHGNQTGRVTLIQNNHFGGYQWFALNNLPYLEGLEINNNYGESFYWLGSIGSVAGNQPTITFNGCDFSMLATSQGTLQRFGDFIGSGAYVFNDCSFKNNRLYQFNNTNGAWIDFNQCKFNADVFEGEPGDTVETYHDIFFRNMLFVVGTYPERIKVNKSRFSEYTETNSLAFPQQDGNGVSFPALLTYTSYWLDRSNEGVDVQYKDLGYPGGYLGIASAFDTYAFSGRTFTGKVKTNYKHGIGIGDALFIRDGDVFLPCMITEIDAGDTITALLMTGYKYNTTTGAFENAFNSTALSTANVQHISSRKFLNTRTITGTFTAGSATVTDVKYVYDGTDAATNFDERTPLLNMDGLLNAQTSPVSNDTWIDSVLTSSSILLSEAAIRNGTFPIQNCFTGNGGDKTAIPVQQIVYGNGNDIKSEAAFNYDSTNNRINLNTTSGERQITLNPKSGETTSTGGIRINSDGVADTDPVGRIEFVSTATGPYTQRGYIGFDGFSNAGASPKGQALVFGLTTDGQSVLGTTVLYENQLAVNNSNTFTIGNNTGRLEISGSTGIYSRDKTWLMGGSAYTTANSNVRLKLAGDNSDTSTTKYGLQIYNGFNQSYFSARNDGNVILGGRTVASEFQILEASGSGTNYTGFKAQPMSANLVYTLPAAAGTAGQQLTWNASNILTWEDAGSSAGGNGIYGGSDFLPDGGTEVYTDSGYLDIVMPAVSGTLYGMKISANTASTVSRFLTMRTEVDSMRFQEFGGEYQMTVTKSYQQSVSDQFKTVADSVQWIEGTIQSDTQFAFISGLTATGWMKRIEGTADNQVLLWNETDGGYWEIGTAGGGSNGIYGGSDEIPDGTIADLATDGVFTFDYSDGSDAIKFDDQTGYVRITDKSGSGQVQVSPGAINIQTSTQITAVVGSNTLDINEDQFRFSADTGTVRLTLFEPSGSGTNYTMFTQPAMAASQTYALPTDAPANGDVLSWNTGGQLSWEAAGGADGNGIYDGDGTLQAGVTSALLPSGGTFQVEYDGGNPGLFVDDATSSSFISGKSGIYALYADNSNAGFTHGTGGWLTGSTYALTGSASVASTNTVTDRLIIQGNVASTVPSTGFGTGILFQGESSTTNNQDMARISAAWTTATHVSREAKIGIELGNNAGALAEIANFNVSSANTGALSIGSASPVVISNTQITIAQSYIIGASASSLTLGGSSGQVTTTSTANAANAVQIQASNTSASGIGSIRLGPTGNVDQTSGTRNIINTTTGFAPTSGTAVHNTYEFSGTFNQTGGANGITRGLYLNQLLTAVVDFRALEIAANGTNGKAIYQTGATMTNNFVGGIAAGTTSAPDASAQIDIVSTTKGLGIPSMTDAQRNAITSPREGLVVYTTDQDALSLRDNGIWKRLPTTRTVLKTADETVNNSSTYQTDDALTFTAKANKKYVVKYYISLNDPNNDVATGGTKFKVTASGATTVKYYAELSNLVFGATYSNNPHSDNAADIYCADAFASYNDDFMYVQMTAYINPGASDRTVNLEWAQINANSNNTKILEGSFLEYEEIN